MKLQRKKKSSLIAVPVAAMGDIAFLLIIFFMIASTFAKEQHIEVEPPRSIDLEELEQAPLSVTVDINGEVYVDGSPCEVNSLESWVSSFMEDRGTKVVMLKVDQNLMRDIYMPVIEALSGAGAEIAVLGENE